MKFKLEDIAIPKEISKDSHKYTLKAVSMDGTIPAKTKLKQFKKNDKTEYEEIWISIGVALSSDRPVKDAMRVKKTKQKSVFEIKIKGLGPRLFFFYLESEKTIVLTNGFYKDRGNSKDQTRAIKTGKNIYDSYMKSKGSK